MRAKCSFLYTVAKKGERRHAPFWVEINNETPQAEPLVLDNLVSSIQLASLRTDLTPVFSFNAQGIYVRGERSAPSDRINRWQDLQQRMRKEGFDAL